MASVERTRVLAAPTDGRARDPQVYHPLDQLRGIIRRYVVIEGLLSAMLFVAVWFTLGLILDYGVFKFTSWIWGSGWDWALDAPKALRVVALLTTMGLFGAILVFRILRRVTKEFSYPALALVLERKFPKLLGDRLITAIEMADVEAMGKFGYSKDMIQATIAEARERVGKVPVSQVFNWRRLWVMGFLTAGLLFATVSVSFASHAIATKSVSPYRFAWKFAHVSGIFAERNVALMNTPWPRNAHIELIGFPETGESTVAQNVTTVPITARATKWVIADRSVTEGWRPMMWSDVTQELIDRKVPTFDFQALRGPDETEGSLPGTVAEWTVDAVERRVAAAQGMGTSHPSAALGDTLPELQEVLKALNAKADRPSMGRTLRKLELTRPVTKINEDGVAFQSEEPIELTYHCRGAVKFRSSATLRPENNQIFTGEVSLKDRPENELHFEFVVKSSDSATRPRRIRLIPLPTLKRLYRTQEEPAYLHHAPAQGTSFDDLKGQRQVMAEKNLSLTGVRSIFMVPAGAQVKLYADAYTDDAGAMPDTDAIVSASVRPVVGRFPGTVFSEDGKAKDTPVPVVVSEGGKGFHIVFKNTWEDMDVFTRTAFSVLKGTYPEKDLRTIYDYRIKDPVDFEITWTNKYNVSTTRSILIQVAQDQPPVVEVGVDVIRKVGREYLVTPLAKIPLNQDSYVKDDHGLSNVEYAYNYYAEDSDLIRALRVGLLTRAFLSAPQAGPPSLNAIVLPRWHAENFRTVDKSDDRRSGVSQLREFVLQDSRLRRDTPDELARLLKIPSGDETNPEAVKKLDLRNPERDFFDLDARYQDGPKKGQRFFPILADPGEAQPTYRMDVYIQATDNNADADGGPRVTRSADPIRLRIVSEGELLGEITKEELQLGERLEEALVKLAAAKRKYDFVRSANGYKEETAEQVDSVKVRHQDALQDVDKARDIVQTVLREFKRIHRECQVNRVIEGTTNNYDNYCKKLEAILSEDPTVEVAFPKTQSMMNSIQNTLNNGRWAPIVIVSDAEQSLFKLEARLRVIREEIGKSGTKEELIRRLREQIDKQKLIEEALRKLQAIWDGEQRAKTPKVGPEDLVVSLKKGETKKVMQTINWRQYTEDEVVVTLVASDPSLVIPPQLTLTFEKNQFRFEYDVKAGMAEGNFKITVKAGTGPSVDVTVTVTK